jgi:hypothetical protein
MDFSSRINDNHHAPINRPAPSLVPYLNFMTKRPANGVSTKTTADASPAVESDSQRFDRVLARAEFKPLKAVIEQLRLESALMCAALITTNSYQMFLGKLGYRVEVVKQLHEQDCYTRLGPKGGVRAVVPLHDTATYSTMVTLVNLNRSVTTTSNSVDFYDRQLAAFKTQIMSKVGNAP